MRRLKGLSMSQRRDISTSTGRRPASSRQSTRRDNDTSRSTERKRQRQSQSFGGHTSKFDQAIGDASMEVLRPRIAVIVIVLVLLCFGIIMVYSASSIEAYSASEGSSTTTFLVRQVIFALGGVVIAALISRIPMSVWNRDILRIIWVISVAALIITVGLGYIGLGAKRWIDLGIISLQPSEFAKVAVILNGAYLMVRWQNGELDGKNQLLLSWLFLAGVPAVFIVIQPDLGTTVVMLVATVAVLWFGELDRKWVYLVIGVVIVVGILFIVLQGFRSARIIAWLNPESDPLGNGYQSLNAYYSISSGGFFGVGLGNSTQKYLYLPYGYNDFIFAVICEEMGMAGALVVIALFIALAFFSFRIGEHADSSFGKIVCDASAAILVFQGLLNISCVVGLLPVTGKPLPFISYGGSSMISTMILVGLILMVSFQDTASPAAKRQKSIRVYANQKQGRRR